MCVKCLGVYIAASFMHQILNRRDQIYRAFGSSSVQNRNFLTYFHVEALFFCSISSRLGSVVNTYDTKCVFVVAAPKNQFHISLPIEIERLHIGVKSIKHLRTMHDEFIEFQTNDIFAKKTLHILADKGGTCHKHQKLCIHSCSCFVIGWCGCENRNKYVRVRMHGICME